MISLKRYLDSASLGSDPNSDPEPADLAFQALAAYSSALQAMGLCSQDACPALGAELSRNLSRLSRGMACITSCEKLAVTDKQVQQQLQGWGRSTARHYQQKSDEVKHLLLVMAHTAESVGARDQRCAGQIHAVTARLQAIASLDDITQIRASIENSAAELKLSIDRMTEEGQSALDRLQQQVSAYRAKLEEAEALAFRDALTGLRSRLCIETLIDRHIAAGVTFCVAIVDIDEFKKVNDVHGHLIGDELLKQFAAELTSACRSTDVIGRWGGDEFLIVLESGIPEASAQTDRLRKWVCGNYTVQERSAPRKLKINASIGLAGHQPGEAMKNLLARADATMYVEKAASKTNRRNSKP